MTLRYGQNDFWIQSLKEIRWNDFDMTNDMMEVKTSNFISVRGGSIFRFWNDANLQPRMIYTRRFCDNNKIYLHCSFYDQIYVSQIRLSHKFSWRRLQHASTTNDNPVHATTRHEVLKWIGFVFENGLPKRWTRRTCGKIFLTS